MAEIEVSSYPWQSDTVYAAELSATGIVLTANDALRAAAGADLDGTMFADLLAREQRDSFDRRVDALENGWTCATFAFGDERGGAAEDRQLWMRRRPSGTIDLVAEPAWREHARLVDQVLQLNDDLIATQRRLARRQRDLEHAQEEAARSAARLRQLEAIVLAGLMPADFDEALQSLLSTAQDILPGDRADILLLDDTGERLVLRASAGLGTPIDPTLQPMVMGRGLLGTIAASGASTLIENLATTPRFGVPIREGSLIGVPLRLRDQAIGVLAVSAADPDSFTEDDLRLLEIVAERMALAIAQAQLRDRERRMAEVLQRMLLPQQLPGIEGVEIAAAYRPRGTSVGGDFYDAVALSDGRVGVAIGDVTGKGLRAAAAMGRLRSALHAYALEYPQPTDVLERLDRLAAADRTMATAIYLTMEPANGRVHLASAGHLPPLLISEGTASYLELGDALSPPLGMTVSQRGQMAFELPVGGVLVAFTDGLVELDRNVDQGLEQLKQAAAGLTTDSVDDLCAQLQTAVAPSGRYRDDVALLVLRRTRF